MNLRDGSRKVIIEHAAWSRKEVNVFRFLQSLQRLAVFLGVLTFRCATASSHAERESVPVEPLQTVSMRVGPEMYRHSLTALLTVTTILSVGCASMQRVAVNKLGDALSRQGDTFSSDEDPELVGSAIPFSLKLIESLLAQSPRHRGLLFAATSGFTQYAFGWIDENAAEIEIADPARAAHEQDRAHRLYLRARHYGLRGIEVAHPGFERALRNDAPSAVRTLTRRDVPLLYWTAASWGLAISLAKDQPEAVVELPIVEAMIDRALELDETFENGAIHTFLISYEMNRQGAEGDPVARSRKHFERAVELSGGMLVSPYVTFAENASVQTQNRADFESLLTKALAIDADVRPQWRLQNRLAQKHAQWLLAHIEEIFLTDPEGETK